MKVQHVLPKTNVQSHFSEASSIKFESQLMRRPLVVVAQYTLAESTLSRFLRFHAATTLQFLRNACSSEVLSSLNPKRLNTKP